MNNNQDLKAYWSLSTLRHSSQSRDEEREQIGFQLYSIQTWLKTHRIIESKIYAEHQDNYEISLTE